MEDIRHSLVASKVAQVIVCSSSLRLMILLAVQHKYVLGVLDDVASLKAALSSLLERSGYNVFVTNFVWEVEIKATLRQRLDWLQQSAIEHLVLLTSFGFISWKSETVLWTIQSLHRRIAHRLMNSTGRDVVQALKSGIELLDDRFVLSKVLTDHCRHTEGKTVHS